MVATVSAHRKFSELLVALDGSSGSRLALDAAVALGSACRSRLHLLHVIPKLDEYARFAHLIGPLIRELSLAGNGIVKEAAEVAARAGLSCIERVREGVPAVGLTEYAADEGVELIVMGSRGLGGKTNYALGSVSYQVAMRASTSVLVVRGSKPFERVLLAHDGSEDARLAADDVIEVAPKFGSKVTVSFIVPARPGGAFTLAGSPMEPFLLETEDRLRKAGIPVVRDLRYGHPAEELVKAAKGYSLLVVGARGRSDLALDYVGGVADKVLRNSSASVLLVR
jgi:nucleotide-binding universal stress UspA family protein